VWLVLQVSLSIELDDSQVDEFQRQIPIQLALPPWNYTHSLQHGIVVKTADISIISSVRYVTMNTLWHQLALASCEFHLHTIF